jgi:hypothetical protein
VKQVEDVAEARSEQLPDLAAADQVGDGSAAGAGQVEGVTAARAEQVEDVTAARLPQVEFVAAARAEQGEDASSARAEGAEPLLTFKDMDMSNGELRPPTGVRPETRSCPGIPSSLKGLDAGNSILLDVNGLHAGHGSPRDGLNDAVGVAGNCTGHAEVLGRETGCDAVRLESEFDGDFIPLE